MMAVPFSIIAYAMLQMKILLPFVDGLSAGLGQPLNPPEA
jgi:hypothetical protein